MLKRVGVIGGGQLAWMMAGAAEKLGVELVIQTPQTTDPAVAIAHHTLFAAIDDANATADLAQQCDVITFENEFIDLEALLKLEQQGVLFYPRLPSLAPLLDKYHQRCYLRDLGLPTPQFTDGKTLPPSPSLPISLSSHPTSFTPCQFPLVFKTRRLGYDGQGTVIVRDAVGLMAVLEQWQDQPFLVEEFVLFERELAVMAARSPSGEIITYPVVETQQENQVCRRVLATQNLDPSVTAQVEAIAHTLLTALDFVGIMGIEFFLTSEGKVLVNETAPRTHNSGHYTLDANLTSQFEQQLRAVCGLPLGDPAMHCAGAVMVNLLGYELSENDYLEKRQQIAQIPQTQVHWYGKSQSRPGRKLGHVTTLLNERSPQTRHEKAMAIAHQIESIWYL